MIDYDTISPGIRDLVRELNEVHGLCTTDSGDGSNYEAGMTCAVPYRHVHGLMSDDMEPRAFIEWLEGFYPEATIEVNLSNRGPDIWSLMPDGYSDEVLEEFGLSKVKP